jgi:hypothetical protein
MGTIIQHIASKISTAPSIGQPWNFNGVLETYLVPRTIAADKKLPPGARLLWGVIRQHSAGDGQCNRSDETLGRLLAVSDRQFRRYAKALESAGLLRTTQRPGKTPIRELLWHSRFAGKIRPGADTSVRGGGHIRPGGRTHPSGPYKEEGTLKGSLQVKSDGGLKSPAPEEPPLRTTKTTAMWSEEDYIRRGRACGFPEYVIQQDLQRLRERKAKEEAKRMRSASELKAEVESSIPR